MVWKLLSQIGPTELLGPRSIEARRVLGQYEPLSLFSKSQTGKDDPNSHFENNLTSLLDETSQSGRREGPKSGSEVIARLLTSTWSWVR